MSETIKFDFFDVVQYVYFTIEYLLLLGWLFLAFLFVFWILTIHVHMDSERTHKHIKQKQTKPMVTWKMRIEK